MGGMQQGLGVLATLGLLAAVLWWLRHKGMAQFALKLPSGAKERRMKAIDRLSLTPHVSLHLVEVDGSTVLIAAGPGGCSVLNSAPARERMPGA